VARGSLPVGASARSIGGVSVDQPVPSSAGAPLRGEPLAVCRVHAVVPDAGPAGSTGIDSGPSPDRSQWAGWAWRVPCSETSSATAASTRLCTPTGRAPRWPGRRAMGAPIPPGLFGENLRVAGLDVDAAVVRER